MALGITMASLVDTVGNGMVEAVENSKKFYARMHAESGLAIGLHPSVSPGDPVLIRQETEESQGGFRVRISHENGRIGINYIYLSEPLAEATRELFKEWGLDPETASTVVDSLIDWMDTDDDESPSGAEAAYYTSVGAEGFPLNMDFNSLDEMLLVRGMDKVDAIKPDWREYFSIYGDGLISPNSASTDVLSALTGAGESEAKRLVETRRGSDGIDGTDDDELYEDLQEVKNQLGLDDTTFSEISSVLTLNSTTLRIESQGWIGDATHTITLIITRTGEGENISDVYLARLER